jgi:hypothetical protein
MAAKALPFRKICEPFHRGIEAHEVYYLLKFVDKYTEEKDTLLQLGTGARWGCSKNYHNMCTTKASLIDCIECSYQCLITALTFLFDNRVCQTNRRHAAQVRAQNSKQG